MAKLFNITICVIYVFLAMEIWKSHKRHYKDREEFDQIIDNNSDHRLIANEITLGKLLELCQVTVGYHEDTLEWKTFMHECYPKKLLHNIVFFKGRHIRITKVNYHQKHYLIDHFDNLIKKISQYDLAKILLECSDDLFQSLKLLRNDGNFIYYTCEKQDSYYFFRYSTS